MGVWSGVKLDQFEPARHVEQAMLTAPQMSTCPDVIHGFSTKVDACGQSLDLRAGCGPEVWTRLAVDAGAAGAPVAWASQVHGRSVLHAAEGGMVGEGDAIWTDVPGLLIAIRTADCVPIVAVSRGRVAAIHAGWRGLAAGVIEAGIEPLRGCGPIHAVVGPAICMDCYEVGEEVVSGVSKWTPEKVFVDWSRTRPHIDPGAAAVHQLSAAGVDHVERIEVCSKCDPRLWSHREEGPLAGRQAGVVGLQC